MDALTRRPAGTGSLRETKPGVWRVKVSYGANVLTGKRKQVSRVVHGNKRAAQAVLDDLKAMAPTAPGDDVVMRAVIEEWWRVKKRAAKTAQTWRPLIDNHVLPTIGHVPAQQVTAPLVLDWHALLAKRGLPPWQVRHCHVIVSSALTYAASRGWAMATTRGMRMATAAQLAGPPPVERKRRRPPGVDVGPRLLAAAADMKPEMIHTWLRVVLVSGCRRNEVLALRWTDLELVERDGEIWGALTVARSLTALSTQQKPGRRPNDGNGGRTGLIIEGPTKKSTELRIGLDPGTVAELVAHRGRVEAAARRGAVRFFDGGFIFAGSLDGRAPLRPEWATRTWGRVCRRAGIEGVVLHDARHRAAAVPMAAGLSAQAVAGHLRHASPKMTLDVYGGAIDDEEWQVARVLGRSLDPGREEAPAAPEEAAGASMQVEAGPRAKCS